MPRRLLIVPTAAAAILSAAPALAAPPIREHTCADGLTVLVAEDHALPLVTVEIAAKNGSMTEPPEYNGLSHLYERPVCTTAGSSSLRQTGMGCSA
jgi:predicted Zn-dependent peptidase